MRTWNNPTRYNFEMAILQRKPFNVTLIQPPAFVHSLALKEAAEYIHATLSSCGYRSTRTLNTVSQDAFNILFCAHLLNGEQIQKIPPDSIIFNSEQLEDDNERRFYSAVYRDLLDRIYVWDYSHHNLSLLSHDNKSIIPFLHCEALKRSNIRRERGLSLLFYGRITPRRQRILQELQRNGIPVQVMFGIYEYDRDVEMLRARAILNLHKNDETRAFEPIRCFYPLINDVPVISESAADDPAAQAYAESVFFFDQASLSREIKTLFDNPSAFQETSHRMLAEFKKKDPLPAVASAVENFFSRCGGR
jgi:hypothetical protein